MAQAVKYAIIVAGGKGLRMGGELPKQFIPLDGKPVLMHTLEAFHAFDPAIELIVVLPHSQQDYWAECCARCSFGIPHRVADGGESRFHSVKNGLALIDNEAGGGALVAVHDGVRPFVSGDVLERCYRLAALHHAVVPVTPVVDTVRHLLADGGSETVDRNIYKLVQTPQVFTVPLLKRAYEQPYSDAFTDDASVVEALGEQVTLCEGSRENIKLTTPFDLLIAQTLLQQCSI